LLDAGADMLSTERDNVDEDPDPHSRTRFGHEHQLNILYICVRRKLALCLKYLLAALPPERRGEWMGTRIYHGLQFSLLECAYNSRSFACLRLLLAAGADPNVGQFGGMGSDMPLLYHVACDDLPEESGESPRALLELLSSYGASRAPVEARQIVTDFTGIITYPFEYEEEENDEGEDDEESPPLTPERILELRIRASASDAPLGAYTQAERASARARAQAALEWLQTSRDWSTPLHHIAALSVERARDLLRSGAHLHTSSGGGPTPLSLANDLHAAGHAPAGSPAALVRAAALPWAAHTHELFPAHARSRAALLICLLYALHARKQLTGISALDFGASCCALLSRAEVCERWWGCRISMDIVTWTTRWYTVSSVTSSVGQCALANALPS
jgi:hypothetical protein